MSLPQPTSNFDRDALRAAHLIPLWDVVGNLVQAEPQPACAPCHWDYANCVRPALMSAGEAVLAEDAERRVLLLGNPSLQRPVTTPTVTAGFQMIKGGEVAESHRHVQSALRLVVEGQGAYTAVNGERLQMRRGDLILTPSWTWHDHEQPSSTPMIWLDGLDVPLMQQLSVSFYEEYGGRQVPQSRPDGFSEHSFGRGLTPLMPGLDPQTDPKRAAPALRFPFEAARGVLRLMEEAGPPSADGYSLKYSNTTNGGHILPTIGAFLHSLPTGFDSRQRRQTDAEIFLVLEGSGVTEVGDKLIRWRENDVFVLPNWTWRRHKISDAAILFSFSDRALQESIGIWREEIREP